MEQKQNDEVEVPGTELQTVEKTANELATKQDREQIMLLRIQLENFTKQLNLSPDPRKIQTHERYKYLPISVVEKDLMKMFFGCVQYEIISFQQILNEFVVHARIKVFHPVLKEWLHYDGIGCGMFQQAAGTPIQDFFMHKRKDGGKLTVPNAYAEAIKNGAKKIGKRFGSDINRSLEDNYAGFFKDVDESQVLNK